LFIKLVSNKAVVANFYYCLGRNKYFHHRFIIRGSKFFFEGVNSEGTVACFYNRAV